MLRTRVGYTGGEKLNPTYRDLGDQSEAIQIDYDPSVISYEELLELAVRSGNFMTEDWSRQYRSAVFYHNKEQLNIARARGIKKLEPVGTFTRAEDYHQKYYLQQSSLREEFYQRYPTARAFTDSVAVTKANAAVGGYLSGDQIEALLPQLKVSEKSAQALRSMAGEAKTGCAVPGL